LQVFKNYDILRQRKVILKLRYLIIPDTDDLTDKFVTRVN